MSTLRSRPPIESGKSARVTVGVPVFNEAADISRLLSEILSSTDGSTTEVIVVSSDSTDDTDHLVRRFEGVQLITEPARQGKMSALERIAKQARGDILILLDGDVCLEPDSLPEIILQFQDQEVLAATARVVPLRGRSGFMYQLAVAGCEAWHQLRTATRNGFLYPSGYLYAVRSELLLEMPFPGGIVNDDAFIAAMLMKKGVLFRYVDRSRVHVLFPQTLGDFIRQKVRTRLGRRQYLYREIFSGVERDWRRALMKVRTTPAIYPKFYYTLDLMCRAIAWIKLSGMPRRSHCWQPVKSTKGATMAVMEPPFPINGPPSGSC